MKNKKGSLRSGFTLIELLVVIAVIAVLAVVVILTLNPGQLLAQSRDTNRLSDMSTLNSALNLYNVDQSGSSNYSLGSSSIIYLSTPDPTATTTAGTNCAGLGFTGNYHCPASSTYRNTNGTGWIPVNLSNISAGLPFSSLPVDPLNSSSSNEYYQYQTNGSTYEITANPESQKYQTQSQANTVQFISGSNTALAGTYATSSGPSITYTTSTLNVGSLTASDAFDSHTNTVWITDVASAKVYQVNDTSPYATSSYTVGSQPEGITFDSHANTLWLSNAAGNSVSQINDTTHVITTLPVTTPGMITFDSHTNTVWVISGGNKIISFNDTTPYASSTYTIAANLTSITFDSHTNTLWMSSSASGTAIQFNDTSFATSSYSVGATTPFDITFDPNTNTLWTANYDKNSVTQINDTTFATTTYAVGIVDPVAVTYDAHSNSIWVTGVSDTSVALINDTTFATTTYAVGSYGGLTIHNITFDSHTNTAWLASNVSGGGFVILTPNH